MSAPVLVVGAGPTGLATAVTLLQNGIGCRVVDRRHAPAVAPRALVLWSGALEVLDRLGIADAVAAQALPLTGARYLSGRRLIGELRFGRLRGTAFPGPLCLPQPAVEQALGERLQALGGGVEWATALDSAAVDDEGARVVLRLPDGRVEQVEASWLVGADGARSAVRAELGLGYEGSTYPRTFLLGDGVLLGDPPATQAEYHLTPDGTLVVVPLPGGGHRVFLDTDPAADPGSGPAPTVEELQALLDARCGGTLRIGSLTWSSRFAVSARVASGYRRGRGLLAGDAAHCHSPAGGQGLNTGVQDGFDLGWKLALLLHGGPDLLDSYEAERRPVALDVVRRADRQTRLWLLRRPVARLLRDTVLGVLSRNGVLESRLVPGLAQHDLDLSASPAVGDPGPVRGTPAGVSTGRRFPDTAVDPVAGTPATRLREVLTSSGHVLLVVAGAGALPVVRRLRADLTARGAAAHAQVVLVLPPGVSTPPGLREDDVVVRDAGGGLHGPAGWAALVRPDGYVSGRTVLADVRRLLDRMPGAAAAATAASAGPPAGASGSVRGGPLVPPVQQGPRAPEHPVVP